MKAVFVAFFAALAVAAPNPVAEPKPDAVADPLYFYGASLTGVPFGTKRSVDDVEIEKRTLIVKRDDTIPEALLTRDNTLEKRTQSPTSGDNANKCGVQNSNWECGFGNNGPCCSINGWCGADSWYCGGGCQTGYGTCLLPYLQLQYDADDGDSIWDIVSDRVYDADVGDGIAYYGATPTSGWA